MAVPAAPTEQGGDKIIFLVYDNAGTNAAALLRAVAAGSLNGDQVAHMAVATHADGGAFAASNPMLVVGGVEGGVARKMLVDANGRVITRPDLAYDAGGGAVGDARPRTLAQGTLNGAAVGHMAVATHIAGATVGASDPVVVMAGLDGTTARRLLASSAGRLLTDHLPTFGGQGHKNVQVTGTAVQLRSTLAVRQVLVKADPGNAAVIYLGGSNVTRDEVEATGGYQLSAGNEVMVPVADIATLYLNGTAGDGASYLYWT